MTAKQMETIEQDTLTRIRETIRGFLDRRSDIERQRADLELDLKNEENERKIALQMKRNETLEELEIKFEEDLLRTARTQFKEQVSMTKRAIHELDNEEEDEALLHFDESVYCGENAIELAIQKLEKLFAANKRKTTKECDDSINDLREEFARKGRELKIKIERDMNVADQDRDKQLIDIRNWFIKTVSEVTSQTRISNASENKIQAFRRFTELLNPELDAAKLPSPKSHQPAPKSGSKSRPSTGRSFGLKRH